MWYARLEARGIDNVRCAVMDGQDLDVEDGELDRAVCHFGLMLFPDRARGFAELRRALRPGGRAVVSAWAGPDRFEALGVLFEALREALPSLPPPPEPPPIFSLADPARFRAEMEAAGFRDVRIDLVEGAFEVPGFDDYWSTVTEAAPPVRTLFDRIGAEGVGKLRATLARRLAERFGDGPIRLRNVATVGTGVA